jgi:hypothetical protein
MSRPLAVCLDSQIYDRLTYYSRAQVQQKQSGGQAGPMLTPFSTAAAAEHLSRPAGPVQLPSSCPSPVTAPGPSRACHRTVAADR